MGCPETGEIRKFPDQDVPDGWQKLRVGEIVKHKKMYFEILAVIPYNDVVVLGGIPENEARLRDLKNEYQRKG